MPRILLLTCLTLLLALPCLANDFEFSRSRFNMDEQSGTEDQSGDTVRLVFVGDCKLGGRTAQQMARHGSDYPFRLVAEELRAADIAFANYESAITSRTTQSPGKPPALVAAGRAFVFKSDPASTGRILADAGFDIVQLANNHAMDYGPDGLLDTLAALDDFGIPHVGAGCDWSSAIAPVVIAAGRIRIGFLAYSAIVPPYSAASRDAPGIAYVGVNYQQQFRRDVDRLREDCDIVVVGFHWGTESRTIPEKSQVNMGRVAIDAGAHLVIGTHTHTFQGVEFYRGGVIAYSLGNFVFTGASRKLAGGILAVEILPDGTLVPKLLPCWIHDGRPTPAPGDEKLRHQLDQVMRATGSQLEAADGTYLVVRPLP